tara:strand:- start:228 stop:380 length:153 start_codon:yes stop_codon:yes gene_type:complete
MQFYSKDTFKFYDTSKESFKWVFCKCCNKYLPNDDSDENNVEIKKGIEKC